MTSARPNRAYISLGSNIDKERNLACAVAELAARVRIIAASAVYETAPVGDVHQENFLNAVVAVETDETPDGLNGHVLRPIEAALGRVRTADRNAPRTIDLDIVAFAAGSAPGPVVLDPEVWTRAHLAAPLAELLPELPHPASGETLRAVVARLAGAGGIVRRHDLDLRAPRR